MADDFSSKWTSPKPKLNPNPSLNPHPSPNTIIFHKINQTLHMQRHLQKEPFIIITYLESSHLLGLFLVSSFVFPKTNQMNF